MSYSINEIIDIAIGLEENGFSFYKQCIDHFPDEKLKDIFSFLAQEELNHKTIFQSMKESSVQGDFNKDYYSYLRSISKNRIFTPDDDPKSVMSKIKTPEDAIQKGFDDEKSSILFYNELKELYKDDDKTQLILDQIINEERKHIKLLLELKEMSLLET